MARKELSEAKRDMSETGNKKLRSLTIEALRDTNSLQKLRSRMGVSAIGFQSSHCECILLTFGLDLIHIRFR